eukprot:GHVH01000248.1.p1 GENE.GHVH01000248.1~~GHVH01000248.1.p1  ORF type:complete len:384 (-),score=69.19 GHVH01000248.1:39-1190(-)
MVLCTVCAFEFSSQELRVHCVSQWHNFNLKRVNCVPPKPVFSREKFAQMQELAREEKVVVKGSDHIKPVDMTNTVVDHDAPKVPRVPQHTDEGNDYDLTYSLFDKRRFNSVEETIEYLEKEFMFSFPHYLPGLELITEQKFQSVRDVDNGNDGNDGNDDIDDEGFFRIPILCDGKRCQVDGRGALLYYLGSIIWRSNECIFCDRHFKGGAESVQKHMADCSHQKMNPLMEEEIRDYYDWRTWLENLKEKYHTRCVEIRTDFKEDASIEEMLHVIGYYECDDQLVIGGGEKVLINRSSMKTLKSRGLDDATRQALVSVAASRNSNKLMTIGDGATKQLQEEQRRQNRDQRKHYEKHVYRLECKNHRLKHIQNMQIAYMMNNTGN